MKDLTDPYISKTYDMSSKLRWSRSQVFKLTELTEEIPYTRVPVKAILHDIQFKGVISDWQPFTDKIKKFKNPNVSRPSSTPPGKS